MNDCAVEKADQNIIMWMDHRAGKQCDVINASKHRVLDFVGGSMSVEMQLPKLLWIKQVLSTKTALFYLYVYVSML